MYVLSHNLDRSSELIERAPKIQENLDSFYDDNIELFRGRDVNKTHFEKRVEMYSSFLDTQLTD
jgi:hypothetical protein